jgi:hypothetical protein
VSTERVGTSETAPTAPVVAVFKLAAADELLFAAVETLVAFAVVLAGKGLAAVATDEGTFVSVCAKMRS